jgi:hypothetical protein
MMKALLRVLLLVLAITVLVVIAGAVYDLLSIPDVGIAPPATEYPTE